MATVPAALHPTPPDRADGRAPAALRRLGYLVVIGIDLAMLYAVTHLLAWGFPSFLTEEFTEVEPWIVASIWVSIAVHVLWMLVDPWWLKLVCDVVTNLVTVAVLLQLRSVFPFTFEGDLADGVRIGLAVLAALVALGTWADVIGRVRRAWPGDTER